MKKILTAIMALTLLASISTTAFAAEINQGSEPKSQSTEITTNITPTYIVTIPADAKISFNAKNTELGTIQATQIQIEPNKVVKVSATIGELKNKTDDKKAIPYKLMNGETEFTSIALTDKEQKADLSVAITESDWNNAYAGDYTGTITFMVSYEAK